MRKFLLFIFISSIGQTWANCHYPYDLTMDPLLLNELKSDIAQTLKKAHIQNFNLLVGSRSKNLVKLSFGKNSEHLKFDLASITKVFTAITLMQILDAKKISIKTKLSQFFSSFNTPEKKHISIEDLLRHNSGLKAGVGADVWSEDIAETWKNILAIKPSKTYGEFTYSDINFLILGKLIEKLTQKNLQESVSHYVFKKFDFKNTAYKPIQYLSQIKCAPTRLDPQRLCQVHDPTSFKLGGITGHAGIFSDLADMEKFTRSLLDEGEICDESKKSQLMPQALYQQMITKLPHEVRGLGFDISSPYARRPRGEYLTKNISYGHTGFTGTSIWIDPNRDLFILILSNATYSKDQAYSKKLYLDLLLRISNFIGAHLI